jgi:hypothetical protein
LIVAHLEKDVAEKKAKIQLMEMQQQIEDAVGNRHNKSRAAAVKKEEAMDMEDADEDVILVDQHQTQVGGASWD